MNGPIIAYRANMGVQTTAPFANTYSLDLDGVDDYSTVGDLSSLVDNKTKLSISFWINLPDAGEQNRITGKYGGSLTKWLGINTSSDKLNFVVSNIGSSLAYASTGAVLTDNTWHHLVCVFDGTQSTANDRIKIYIDNVDEALTVNGSLPTSTYDFTLEATNPTWYLGQNGYVIGSNELRGKLDEYAIYSNVALTSSQVTEIYNSGTPNDLSTLTVTPDLWLRMGDNGAYKSPQWLIPNNENFVANKVSNYSFEFDAIDDYIDLSSASNLNFTNDFTLSAWVKTSAIGANQFVIDKSTSASVGNGYSLRILNTGKVRFWSYAASGLVDSTTILSADTWYHIAATHDRSGAINKIYINGALDVGGASGTFNPTINNLRIGTSAVLGNPFGGKIDSVSFYDSELSASDILTIYNSGTPTTLPSGAVAHYKMGEEATFSGGVWTVPDQIGSNDGTSNGMTVEDRVGEAPNSENNALSFNMDLVDRTTNVPT